MFPQVIAPIIGALLISISLITLSSNVNPSLHIFMVIIQRIFILLKK